MSTVIKSLFISAIEVSYSADDIMDVFYCQNIATISRITLIPYESISGVRNRAYIDIHEWHPTEAAYNFIKRLKENKYEARIVHSDDNWCVVGVNKKPLITNSKKMSKFTTINYLVVDMAELECLPWLLNGDNYEDDYEWETATKSLSELVVY
jgi:hypothetical protein